MKIIRVLIAVSLAAVGLVTIGQSPAIAKTSDSIFFSKNYLGKPENIWISHSDRVACLIEVTGDETYCTFDIFYANYAMSDDDRTFMNLEVQDEAGNKIGYGFTTLYSSKEVQRETVVLHIPIGTLPKLTLVGKNSSGVKFTPSKENVQIPVFHQWPMSEWQEGDSKTPFFSNGQYDIKNSGMDISESRYNFFIEVDDVINPVSWTGSSTVSIIIDTDGDERADFVISTPKSKLKLGYGTATKIINAKTRKALSQSLCDADAWISDQNTFAFSFTTKCIKFPFKFGYQAQIYDSKFRGLDVNPDYGYGTVHRNYGTDVVSAYASLIASEPKLPTTATVDFKRIGANKVQIVIKNVLNGGEIQVQRNWGEIAKFTATETSDKNLVMLGSELVWTKTMTLARGWTTFVVYQDNERIGYLELKY